MTADQLVKPAREHLPSYVDALNKGWSPDNVRGAAAAREQLEKIAADPDDFIERLEDREARGGPVPLPDGTFAKRLPGFRRWVWDGVFCGSISLRWQPGSNELPPQVLGHIGYGIVPWKEGRGYATRALAGMLTEARLVGLHYVELTTDPDNPASQRVITANGGVLIERFTPPPVYGDGEKLRFRIDL